ncbi:MAG: hypothetical protein A2527_06325 [Candidatus Lambdaproteobacteria bacterium RIFOXYD2_FULL_50_16]|uniref:Uncharacterized protein n=1 Tax=Candidatus Lambdaproteobacteria bacterium RIFOXYD2_FULL_50_16 TaxID=1817772 RepID=A0A1F6GA16_9PROT|nr:MAG: hypothetical protein A2527_06325 [Candidatus Lambdaproteobacteria bacterium RIFOXYD2_FULL_50_16]
MNPKQTQKLAPGMTLSLRAGGQTAQFELCQGLAAPQGIEGFWLVSSTGTYLRQLPEDHLRAGKAYFANLDELQACLEQREFYID